MAYAASVASITLLSENIEYDRFCELRGIVLKTELSYVARIWLVRSSINYDAIASVTLKTTT